MALPTQVPFTDLGGPPCCCDDTECPDLGDGPTGVEFVTAVRHSISSDQWLTLYYGGTIKVTLSGSSGGTAISIFGTPPYQCTASGGRSSVYNITTAPGCSFVSNSSNTTLVSGDSGARPIYHHYLEGYPDDPTVFFYLQVSHTSSQNCASNSSVVAVVNATVNDNNYPVSGGPTGAVAYADTLTVKFSEAENDTLTVATFTAAYGTDFVFNSHYENVSGNMTGEFDWTPAAP